MIYKFCTPEQPTRSLEFELFNEFNQPKECPEVVLVSILEDEIEEKISFELTKRDVFQLIGALHLLHKEMK